MVYPKATAHERALDLVRAALSSGSIKLQGSSDYPDNNKAQLAADAAYLNGLVNSLAANLTEKQ